MSAKRSKQRRRAARREYKFRLEVWHDNEPPRWRLLAHRRWKKQKPKTPRGV